MGKEVRVVRGGPNMRYLSIYCLLGNPHISKDPMLAALTNQPSCPCIIRSISGWLM